MRVALLCLALVACGTSENSAPSSSAPAKQPPAARGSQPNTSELQAPADLCDAYDRAGVATAFGWKGMQKTSATGMKHGEKRERHCGYRSLDEGAKDATFGVTFSTELAFEKRHLGFDITYAKREPIDGNEAWSGHTKDVVALQVVAKGIRLSTDLSNAGTPEEAEPKLALATQKIVASLPPDAVSMMHK